MANERSQRVPPPPPSAFSHPHRVERWPAGSIAIRVQVEYRLRDRLQHHLHDRLRHPIGGRRYAPASCGAFGSFGQWQSRAQHRETGHFHPCRPGHLRRAHDHSSLYCHHRQRGSQICRHRMGPFHAILFTQYLTPMPSWDIDGSPLSTRRDSGAAAANTNNNTPRRTIGSGKTATVPAYPAAGGAA